MNQDEECNCNDARRTHQNQSDSIECRKTYCVNDISGQLEIIEQHDTATLDGNIMFRL